MRLTSIRRSALVAGLACLAAAPAQAQEPAEVGGYVLPGWTFTPGFTLSSLYDSNVSLAGRSAETGTTEGDNLVVLVPSARVSLIAPRTTFSAGYRGYLRRYLDIEQLNGYDQRADLHLRHQATPRVTWFVQNEFSESPTTDLVQLNGLPFARLGTRANIFGGGVDARLTKYTDLHVKYENTWTTFDRQQEVLSDGIVNGGTVNGVRAALRRRLSERLAVGAEGRVRRSDLRRVDPRVIWLQNAGALLDYRLTPHVTVTVAAGLSRLTDSRFDTTRQSPYYRAQLDRSVEHMSAGVAFERSYMPSFGFSGSNDTQELRGYVHLPFSQNRLYVQSDGLWRRSNPFFADEIRLDTWIVTNTVGYALTRWMRVQASHAYSRQDSIITGGEVDRHRAGVQLVVSQPMRIR